MTYQLIHEKWDHERLLNQFSLEFCRTVVLSWFCV